jgi:hypothetical protein
VVANGVWSKFCFGEAHFYFKGLEPFSFLGLFLQEFDDLKAY